MSASVILLHCSVLAQSGQSNQVHVCAGVFVFSHLISDYRTSQHTAKKPADCAQSSNADVHREMESAYECNGLVDDVIRKLIFVHWHHEREFKVKIRPGALHNTRKHKTDPSNTERVQPTARSLSDVKSSKSRLRSAINSDGIRVKSTSRNSPWGLFVKMKVKCLLVGARWNQIPKIGNTPN